MAASRSTPEQRATALRADLAQVVKSLVFVVPRPQGRLLPIVCLVSGRNQVDLGSLAAVAGEVNIRLATASEVSDLTGYSIGGVPPFGYDRDVRIVMDQDLARYQWVWATAGTDTAVFRVAPRVLRTLSDAVVAPVSETSWIRASSVPEIEPLLEFAALSSV
jgi:prolyl-tRNA editing enzyme YbaK/EbsC (Cys-tRNA(Pro) deacylase)